MTGTPSFNLLTILGQTASGKTRLAVALAQEYGGEIISADSRQVFRGMDIGSGKDLHEYGQVPYHLIDIVDAGGEFSVFEFQRRFYTAYTGIVERHALPLLCGGSGMYLDAILRGYRLVEVPYNGSLRAELALKSDAELADELRRLKPEQHNSTDLLERERTIRAIEIACGEHHVLSDAMLQSKDVSSPSASIGDPALKTGFPITPSGMTSNLLNVTRHEIAVSPEIHSLVIGIQWERVALRRRITARLEERLTGGMIEEVQRLHQSGISWGRLDYYGLEYRYVGAFLRGELNRNEMFQKLNCAIHDFAKRQGNWFRRMEKHGIAINWIDGAGDQVALANKIINKK
jgi:tRNA dimethylallyltransferase